LDKQTYLIILFGGQLALLGLDLREQLTTRRDRPDASPLRLPGILFLVATVLVYGGLQYGGLALVPGAEQLLVSSRAFVNEFLSGTRTFQLQSTWAILLIGTAAFYFGGLCDYLLHRYVSHSRPMWFTHENHHLPTDVSVYMPGLCARPFAVVAIFPTMALTIFALQLSLGVTGLGDRDVMPFLYAAVLVQVGIGSTSHSAYLRRCWWIHRALKPLGLTTPQEHWLHHVAELDGNFGNFTTLWDRVFGTYLDPETSCSRDLRAGLKYDQDFLGTLTMGRIKFSENVRRRFQLEEFCYLEPERSCAKSNASPTIVRTPIISASSFASKYGE
jgi:sterol desaturase/sphingolipid hydroxylase (fatty acid hydroxylase superfamily)